MIASTRHAQARMQQRGITADLVEIVLSMGVPSHDRDGTTFYCLQDRKRRQQLASHLRRVAEKLETQNGLFAVESGNGELITVGHQDRRRQHRKAYTRF